MSGATLLRRSRAGDRGRHGRRGRQAAPAHRQAVLDEELARSARPAGPAEPREERSRPGVDDAAAEAGGGRLTLGEVVAGAWEGLLAAGSAPCPACGGAMEWRGEAGRCGDCGSTLS